ncbi:hypothetical protein CANINC_004066 [Pichia inconspicua]|uniref:poly(A)-specific ribonuclease n=1 Tax=Pichia inconspicua TaxID=52247 RepID=A0A4V4NFA8_9ASCO|nr:hypothetical protein CANINC_004066 [[Candida] inconspicua]
MQPRQQQKQQGQQPPHAQQPVDHQSRQTQREQQLRLLSLLQQQQHQQQQLNQTQTLATNVSGNGHQAHVLNSTNQDQIQRLNSQQQPQQQQQPQPQQQQHLPMLYGMSPQGQNRNLTLSALQQTLQKGQGVAQSPQSMQAQLPNLTSTQSQSQSQSQSQTTQGFLPQQLQQDRRNINDSNLPVGANTLPLSGNKNTNVSQLELLKLYQLQQRQAAQAQNSLGHVPDFTHHNDKNLQTQFLVRDVWKENFESELVIIRQLAERFNHIFLSTEIAGVIARPVGSFRSTKDYHYQTMRSNADLLNLIQVGITLSDKDGKRPEGVPSTWQFNFAFDLDKEMFNKESIELLMHTGLNFDKLKTHGIDRFEFAQALIDSGLCLLDNTTWVSFHAGYDFGFLISLMINKEMLSSEVEFDKSMTKHFSTFYDLKLLSTLNPLSNLKQGVTLESLSDELGFGKLLNMNNLTQVGGQSLLTYLCFWELKRLSNQHEFEQIKNQVFGLNDDKSITSNNNLVSAPVSPSIVSDTLSHPDYHSTDYSSNDPNIRVAMSQADNLHSQPSENYESYLPNDINSFQHQQHLPQSQTQQNIPVQQGISQQHQQFFSGMNASNLINKNMSPANILNSGNQSNNSNGINLSSLNQINPQNNVNQMGMNNVNNMNQLNMNMNQMKPFNQQMNNMGQMNHLGEQNQLNGMTSLPTMNGINAPGISGMNLNQIAQMNQLGQINPMPNVSNIPNIQNNIPGMQIPNIPNMSNLPNIPNGTNMQNMSNLMNNMHSMNQMPNISNMPNNMQGVSNMQSMNIINGPPGLR